MRRHAAPLVTLLAVVVLLVGGLGYVVLTWDSGAADAVGVGAALPSSSATGTASPAATGTVPAASTSGPLTTSTRGSITTVESTSWTVTTSAGLAYRVEFTPATTFKRGSAAKYKVGLKVTVDGTLTDGVLTATAVR